MSHGEGKRKTLENGITGNRCHAGRNGKKGRGDDNWVGTRKDNTGTEGRIIQVEKKESKANNNKDL